MIITKLQGGLANQLFQWAYARHISNKYNLKFYVDLEFYDQIIPDTTKRSYSLSKFPNINAEVFDRYNLTTNKSFQQLSDNFIFSYFNFNPDYNYYLNGYWQSEKYFSESSELIRKELSPSEDMLKNLKKTPFLDTNTISLHVRRGDYLNSNGYHPVQSVEYYKNAIDIVGDYDYIFVFSDDIKWCKDNLKFDNMIFIEGLTDIEDLHLMSLCNHNIIANSSFSWWGAWLNSNPDKKVIAPIKWFGDKANLNCEDIIPDNWIKI